MSVSDDSPYQRYSWKRRAVCAPGREQVLKRNRKVRTRLVPQRGESPQWRGRVRGSWSARAQRTEAKWWTRDILEGHCWHADSTSAPFERFLEEHYV